MTSDNLELDLLVTSLRQAVVGAIGVSHYRYYKLLVINELYNVTICSVFLRGTRETGAVRVKFR